MSGEKREFVQFYASENRLIALSVSRREDCHFDCLRLISKLRVQKGITQENLSGLLKGYTVGMLM